MGAPSESEMERPERKVILYWHLVLAAWSAAILGLALSFVGPFAVADTSEPIVWGMLAAWVGLAGLMGIYVLAAPHVRYRTFRFAVEGERLWARDGVIVQREKVIPSARLQHVDVTAGPLERLFGIASVVVFTAGGATATYRVPGLSPERAAALRDRVLETAERHRRIEAQSMGPVVESPAP